MARTQLRLDSISGSYASGQIEQSKVKQVSYATMTSADMNGVLSDVASSIKRIHGLDFASQDAGVFNHTLMKITGSLGITTDLNVVGTSSFGDNVYVGGGYGSTGVTISSAGAVQMDGQLRVEGAALLDGYVDIGGGYGSTGVTIIHPGNISADGALVIDGTSTLSGNVTVGNGFGAGGVTISNAGTIQMAGALTVSSTATFAGGYGTTGVSVYSNGGVHMDGELIVDGTSTLTGATTLGGTLDVAGTTTVSSLIVGGDLYVNGTTTTINSTTMTVDDKNIELAHSPGGASSSNTLADGGGITLKGTTDHTIIWRNSQSAWEFSEHLVPSGTKDLGLNSDRWQNLWLSGNITTSGQLIVTGASDVGELNASGITTLSATIVLDQAGDQIIEKSSGDLIISGSSDIRLKSQAAIKFKDSYHSGITDTEGMSFTAASSEWTTFVSNFGQSSLISAINTIAAGSSAGKGKWIKTLSAAPSPNADKYTFLGIDRIAGDSSVAPNLSTAGDRTEIYLNGQLMISGSDYLADSGALVDFTFDLRADDAIIAIIR